MGKWVPISILVLLLSAGCGGRQEGSVRNAVVILIDTCRYDEVGRKTPEGPVTPKLDLFAKGATRFLKASSPAPWTLPSVASLLTSLYPTVHGAVGHYPDFSRLRSNVVTGPELLREAGYRTCAFVNCAFLDPTLELDRGFETYDYFPASNLQIRNAEETFQSALRWLDEAGKERFFLLVHLFDPHMDYNPPEPFLSQFLGNQPRHFAPPFGDVSFWREAEPKDNVRAFARALYRAEIAAVDAACGKFLSALDERGLSSQTVVVVTADHGEEFWDHRQFEHGHTLYDELIHVPLLIRAPGRSWPQEVQSRVGLIDLMPTLFELLGVPILDSFQGESLLPLLEGNGEGMSRDRFAESLLYGAEWKAVLDDRYKFMYREEDDRKALFDLATDPSERNTLAEEMPERTQEMAGRMLAWFRETLALTGGTQRGEEIVDMEEEVIQRLRALGYID